MDLQKALEESEQRGAQEPAPVSPVASQVDRRSASSFQQDIGRETNNSDTFTSEICDQVARSQAREASPELAYPTPALVGPEYQGTPRPEQRENNDRESSVIDNPLALKHPEFTETAEGTARTYLFRPRPLFFSLQL